MNKILFSFFKGMNGPALLLMVQYGTQLCETLLFQLSAPTARLINKNVIGTVHYQIREGG
jgi:hypothetical protein